MVSSMVKILESSTVIGTEAPEFWAETAAVSLQVIGRVPTL